MYEIFVRLLKERNLKASDVSKATGIPSSTFTDWKKGRYTPKVDKLKLIADFLGVTLDYLQTGTYPDFESSYINETSFENYLSGIGWKTTYSSENYIISNGTISVIISTDEFKCFENEIRNRCIETITDFINDSINANIGLKAAHPNDNPHAGENDTPEADINKL